MAQYKLKVGKAGRTAVDTHKKIEDIVVGTYKKIENAFVDKFLEKVEDDTRETNNTKTH